jgi:tetratricopeptide (TPR) repeat protein
MLRRFAVLLLLFGSCGLLEREPDPPAAEAVVEARDADAAEWALLAEAVTRAGEAGPRAVAVLEDLRATSSPSLRLDALIQDLAVRDAGSPEAREALRQGYAAAAAADPTPGRLYLAARIAAREPAMEWVERALAVDPAFVPARVLHIGLTARPGDPAPLQELLRLLDDHPGCAEGWRLLGRLAPLYDRPDLALRAAATEPWLPGTDPRPARLAEAAAALAADRPDLALTALAGYQDREAELLRAAAHADAGRPEPAQAILERLLAEAPDDPQVHFDLGLLARDHLGRPALARQHLRRFLELARAADAVPLQRQIQAEVWLEDLGGSLREAP